jgi:hypothetical protein
MPPYRKIPPTVELVQIPDTAETVEELQAALAQYGPNRFRIYDRAPGTTWFPVYVSLSDGGDPFSLLAVTPGQWIGLAQETGGPITVLLGDSPQQLGYEEIPNTHYS